MKSKIKIILHKIMNMHPFVIPMLYIIIVTIAGILQAEHIYRSQMLIATTILLNIIFWWRKILVDTTGTYENNFIGKSNVLFIIGLLSQIIVCMMWPIILGPHP